MFAHVPVPGLCFFVSVAEFWDTPDEHVAYFGSFGGARGLQLPLRV